MADQGVISVVWYDKLELPTPKNCMIPGDMSGQSYQLSPKKAGKT
jgi:hypothetical protein